MIGKDMRALWALFAAAIDPRIGAVICHGGLLYYRSLFDGNDRYLHGANALIPGVLRQLDLPHVAAALAGRRLSLLSPVDAMKRPVSLAAAESLDGASAKADAKIRIAARDNETDLASQYLTLLQSV